MLVTGLNVFALHRFPLSTTGYYYATPADETPSSTFPDPVSSCPDLKNTPMVSRDIMTAPDDTPELLEELDECVEGPLSQESQYEDEGDEYFSVSRRTVLTAMAAGSVVPASTSSGVAYQDQRDTLELRIRTPHHRSHGIEDGDDLDVYITYTDLETQYNNLGLYASGGIPPGSLRDVTNPGRASESDGTKRFTVSYDEIEPHIEDGKIHLYAGANCDRVTVSCTYLSDPVTIEQVDWEDESEDDEDGWWFWDSDDSDDSDRNENGDDEDCLIFC